MFIVRRLPSRAVGKLRVVRFVLVTPEHSPVSLPVIGEYYRETWFTPEGARLKYLKLRAKGLPSLADWRFITLTVADREASPEVVYLRGKDRLRVFTRWWRETLGRDVLWCWKLELHEDGYPHWHMLVWLPKSTPPERKAKILENSGQLWRNAWHKITHSTDAAHLAKFGVQVTECKSRKHAYSYCSKYLAKTEFETLEAGRRWGRIGQFDTEPELSTEITQRQYIHLKRLLNAYLKAEALKRFENQKIVIPYAPLPLEHFRQFWRYFKRMTIAKGSTVFGLGFISQDAPIDAQTIYKMIRHARDLALDDEKTMRLHSVKSR